MKKILEIAEKIARQAHEGQFRYNGKTPYIEHVEGVVSKFIYGEVTFISKNYMECGIVAWLHDVVEDSNATFADLLSEGIPFHLVVAIEAITKKEHEDYLTYILRVKENKLALKVKLEDIRYNLADTPTKNQKQKYILAQYILDLK